MKGLSAGLTRPHLPAGVHREESKEARPRERAAVGKATREQVMAMGRKESVQA